MADSDLIGAIITAWSQELNSSNPTIKSEANGAMLLARKVGAGNIALISAAASATGMEPSKLLDQVEARAKSLAHGQNIASRPRPLTASRTVKNGAINRG